MPKRGQYKKGAKKDSVRQRKYNGTEKQKQNRAARNKARAQAERDGRVSKGDGKDIDHKTPLRRGGSNAKSNTRVQSKSKNRANNGSKKGMKRNGVRK